MPKKRQDDRPARRRSRYKRLAVLGLLALGANVGCSTREMLRIPANADGGLMGPAPIPFNASKQPKQVALKPVSVQPRAGRYGISTEDLFLASYHNTDAYSSQVGEVVRPHWLQDGSLETDRLIADRPRSEAEAPRREVSTAAGQGSPGPEPVSRTNLEAHSNTAYRQTLIPPPTRGQSGMGTAPPELIAACGLTKIAPPRAQPPTYFTGLDEASKQSGISLPVPMAQQAQAPQGDMPATPPLPPTPGESTLELPPAAGQSDGPAPGPEAKPAEPESASLPEPVETTPATSEPTNNALNQDELAPPAAVPISDTTEATRPSSTSVETIPLPNLATGQPEPEAAPLPKLSEEAQDAKETAPEPKTEASAEPESIELPMPASQPAELPPPGDAPPLPVSPGPEDSQGLPSPVPPPGQLPPLGEAEAAVEGAPSAPPEPGKLDPDSERTSLPEPPASLPLPEPATVPGIMQEEEKVGETTIPMPAPESGRGSDQPAEGNPADLPLPPLEGIPEAMATPGDLAAPLPLPTPDAEVTASPECPACVILRKQQDSNHWTSKTPGQKTVLCPSCQQKSRSQPSEIPLPDLNPNPAPDAKAESAEDAPKSLELPPLLQLDDEPNSPAQAQ